MRMQERMPEAVNLDAESEETHKLYGLDDPDCEDTGRKCLLARRLVERGVRCVQIYSGSAQCGGAWDAHSDLKNGHRKCARSIDRPVAGLLRDLKQRGMLHETLVVGLSEFGRMPISQGGSGRDHNPGAQTMWLAGPGIRAGTVVGATDELGYRAVESAYHMRDLHATILRLMGLDDMRLTFYFNGRNYRLTDNGGQLIKEALA
jgi:arylsulfatase A-like enzyme